MRSYTFSKPPSMVNPGWIYWSAKDLENPDSNQIAAFLFVTRKKEVCLLYKPMPIINDGKFAGFIGNMFNEGSTLPSSQLMVMRWDPVLLSNILLEFLKSSVPKSPSKSIW
jgi:hypothetical protein